MTLADYPMKEALALVSGTEASDPAIAAPCTAGQALQGRIEALERKLETLEAERAAYFLDSGKIPLPVEPLYSLELAAELVPCKVDTIYGRMRRHPEVFGPTLYRRDGRLRWHRMIRASEIRALRKMMIKPRRTHRS